MPWGETSNSLQFSNIEMQGTVLAPLKCSVSVDLIGKDALTNMHQSLYLYKSCVTIPPLSMIDDIISVTKCTIDSINVNALIEAKTSGKQLNLSQKKCSLMHIGKNANNCKDLKVDGSYMKTSHKQTYLGDVLSSDGKIDHNITERYNKGIGVANQLLALLKEVHFGHFYFEMAILFRNSILVNSILCSIEALHGLKASHVDKLESCDKFLLRKILNARSSTATEAFYLETGLLPIRFFIIARRLMYYWNILQKSDSELVKQVFNAQKILPLKNDWILQIEDDLMFCDIQLSETEITCMKKEKCKTVVKENIRTKAREYLLNLKSNHSKSKGLNEDYLLQPYLQSETLTLQEKQLLFQFRTYTYDVKSNFKNKYNNDLNCPKCQVIESQEHLFKCSITAELSTDDSQHEHVFGNLEDQKKIVKVLTKFYQRRTLNSKHTSLAGSHVHQNSHSAGG